MRGGRDIRGGVLCISMMGLDIERIWPEFNEANDALRFIGFAVVVLFGTTTHEHSCDIVSFSGVGSSLRVASFLVHCMAVVAGVLKSLKK